MRKGLWILLCGLLVAALLFLLNADNGFRKETDENSSLPPNESSGALVIQKSNLIKKRDQVQKEYMARMQGMGTVTLLYTQPDAVFMDIVVPMMEEYGLTGMVAFSQDMYPGLEGCISPAQWQRLQDAGWEICLRWDGSTMLALWLENMNALLSARNISTSLTVLVPEELFTMDLLVQARQMNLKAVIHHGEDIGITYHRTIQSNDVWLPSVVPWHLENTSETVENTVAGGGSLVLEVYNEIVWEGGYRRLFKNMLDKLSGWQAEDKLRVATVNQAIAYRQGVLLGSMELEKEMRNHLESLNLEIKSVEDRIHALYVQ